MKNEKWKDGLEADLSCGGLELGRWELACLGRTLVLSCAWEKEFCLSSLMGRDVLEGKCFNH